MRRIESVIFDWGGVLIDNPRPGLLQYCADAFGVPLEHYTPVHDLFLDAFQKGLISEGEFWRRISRKLGKPAGCKAGKPAPEVPSLWFEAFRRACVPRPEAFSLVSSLREKGYKTALLSNTELPAVEFLSKRRGRPMCLPGATYDMFDVLVFSCEQGVAKPERRIYEITLEKLGSEAPRSVFIDDREDYIQGAREAGLNAILFKSIDQVKQELAGLGVK